MVGGGEVNLTPKTLLALVLLIATMALAMPASALALWSEAPIRVPVPPGTYAVDVRPGASSEGYWSWSDYPYAVPFVEPYTVIVAEDLVFGNWSGPVTVEFQTPTGSYSRVLLKVELWLESQIPGRPAVQYDRPLWIWINGAPALIGTTVQRFNQTCFADVTHLYPLLVGGDTATLTVALPNWVLPAWGLTGIFHVRVKLLYYPGPKPPGVPDAVIPLFDNSTATPWKGLAVARLTVKKPVAWQLTYVPENTIRAYLLVYTEGASYDEFWYYMIPPDRYVMFESDGRLFAFLQPYPYMYTGSLNPLLWRPVSGVRTHSFEPHLIDVTPLLPLLAGTHNLTLSVYNMLNYWYVFAALLVYTDSAAFYVNYQLLDYNVTGPLRDVSQGQLGTGAAYYGVSSSMQLRATSMITVYRFMGSYSYVVEGSMYNSIESMQVYDEVWSNLTLTQLWNYAGGVVSVVPSWASPMISYSWSEAWNASLNAIYGFIIEAEETGEYPVTGNFTLYTTINQTLDIDRGEWPFTKSTRTLYEAVDATAYIKGTIMLISPTAGIITGITDTYGDTVRVTSSAEIGRYVGDFSFFRRIHAGNEWPQWWIYEDTIEETIG